MVEKLKILMNHLFRSTKKLVNQYNTIKSGKSVLLVHVNC